MVRAAGGIGPAPETAGDAHDSYSDVALVLERVLYGFWILCNHGKQHLGCLIWMMRALLPISHRADGEMEPRGEFLLGKLQLLAQGAH